MSPEEAEGLLAPGERIHTFRQATNGVLLGAEWDRAAILEALRRFPVEPAGATARAMGHGLVIHDKMGGSSLFVATRREAPDDG